MKKHKHLIIICLTLLFFSCKTAKETLTIQSDGLKATYKQNESVNLTINNPENFEIEKVIYFSNSKEIGTALANKTLNFNLIELPLGNQNIKAKIYTDNEIIECFTSFDVLSSVQPTLLNYQVLNAFPHDKNAYTQGFEFYNGTLLEGTGQNGASSLRKTDYKLGAVLKNISLDEKYFGEGITVFNNKIYQLTWQQQVGFIYNADTFVKEKTFSYFKNMEGWGLTHNNKELIMSDGTDKIYFLNPETQKMNRFITVCSNEAKIDQINELEYINGKIWANIYQKDIVVIINPNTGAIENVIDFSDLNTKITNTEKDVLNGIAYKAATNTIFITGKNWDKTFEIKLK